MKKIIGGKVYDTKTAVEVGKFCNAGGWRDFNHFEETLYRKKNGEYFLHGEGGPNTRYSEQVEQNSWSGGEKIVPLTFEDAKAWAEKNLDGNEYEAIFGAVVDDDTLVALNTTLSATANDKLRKMASASGVSLKTVLEKLILDA